MINNIYREVHAAELADEGFHPGIILFVDWFVHLKQSGQRGALLGWL